MIRSGQDISKKKTVRDSKKGVYLEKKPKKWDSTLGENHTQSGQQSSNLIQLDPADSRGNLNY
jgi:hypothetical protein